MPGFLAALIPAGIGLAASLIGGSQSNRAINRASAAEQAAQREAIAEQRRQFDLTRQDYMPWTETGADALTGTGGLADILGLNGPEAQAAAMGTIGQSPMLARLIEQGTEGVLQNASATGGVRGGNTIGALADFRSDAFNQVLNDQIGRLGGLAGAGGTMVGNLGGLRAGMAGQISNSLGQIGSSQAGRFLGRAGVNNQMINNISGILGSIVGKVPGLSG